MTLSDPAGIPPTAVEQKGLYQKARKGGFLITLSNVLQLFLALGRTIIIARFLAPEEIGLMGIVLFILAILESITETGFSAALIQQKEDIHPYLDTAWSVSLVRGFALYGILFLAAPLLAGFFEAPAVVQLLQVVGLAFLFEGAKNIGVTLFRKELDFRQEFIFQQLELLADMIVTIVLVMALRNVWALVLGYVAGKAVKCLASFILHPFRPRLTWDRHQAARLYRFGKHLMYSSVIILLITQGDNAVVGKLLGSAALGLYVMAYKISNLPATGITHAISQVAFPAYAKLQDDIDLLRRVYLKSLRYLALVIVPACGGIAILARELVTVLLGSSWLPIVVPVQILCVFGLLRAIASTTGPLFQGVGRPDIITKLNLVKLLVISALIVPLTRRYGIVGASLAVTIPMVAEQFFAWFICARILKGRVRQIGAALAPSFAGTLVMMAILFLLARSPIVKTNVFSLAGLIGIGAVSYGLFLRVCWKSEVKEFVGLFRPAPITNATSQ